MICQLNRRFCDHGGLPFQLNRNRFEFVQRNYDLLDQDAQILRHEAVIYLDRAINLSDADHTVATGAGRAERLERHLWGELCASG